MKRCGRVYAVAASSSSAASSITVRELGAEFDGARALLWTTATSNTVEIVRTAQ
jgi:predicted transcriptional regulator